VSELENKNNGDGSLPIAREKEVDVNSTGSEIDGGPRCEEAGEQYQRRREKGFVGEREKGFL